MLFSCSIRVSAGLSILLCFTRYAHILGHKDILHNGCISSQIHINYAVLSVFTFFRLVHSNLLIVASNVSLHDDFRTNRILFNTLSISTCNILSAMVGHSQLSLFVIM